MQIASFLPHYQLVCISFDISSFSLISYYLITTNQPYTCAMITTKIVSTTYFSFIANDLQEYHIVVSTKLKSYKYDNR